MRDAFGGVVNLAMIVIFLVLVTGYLAFNVNYTKAFRVKNYIITKFEQYEGSCDRIDSDCNKEIQSYIKSIGYHQPKVKLAGFNCDNGYCFKEFKAKESSEINDRGKQVYYRVVTQIIIDIPIVNKIMPNLKIFQVAGDTKLITLFE